MQVQLKPLTELLNRVKDLPVPEFGSLQAWEARANAASRAANGDSSANDSSKSSQGQGYGGTPMPFLGETKVFLHFLYSFFVLIFINLIFFTLLLSFSLFKLVRL